MKPKFSFLIATKDRSDLIGETLQSLIDQTIPEWEAVVVDGGNDDKTKKVVESFNDSRLRYYALSPDHGTGASCARNFAAIVAQADIIGIMDDDDLAYPNRIEVTLEAFTREPDAALFYSFIDILNEEDHDKKTNIVFHEFSIEALKESCIISHPTVAMKRQVLLDNPYNPYFRLAEDYELYTRLAAQGKKFIYSPLKLIKYRIHKNNISLGDPELIKIRGYYGLIPRMMRGWIPFDFDMIEKIERKANEDSSSRPN